MSNLTTIPAIDWFETTLAQSWNGAVGTVYVDSIPASTFPSGEKTYIVVNPWKTNMQVARVSAWTTGQFTVDSVSVMKWSTSLAYSQQSHAVKSKVIISDNYQFWLDIQTAINSKLDSNGGNPSSTFDLDLTWSAFRIRKDGSNMKFTDDTTAEVTLATLASGGGADQKVSVTVSDTTTGVLDAKLTMGAWLKRNVVNPAGAEVYNADVDLADTTVFVATSSGAGDSGKVSLLNASWQVPEWFINNIYNKFWGTSADGAVDGTANVTITWSNNTYIVKNYSSWTAGTSPRICTTTPTGWVTHIKIKWNADLSNRTFSYSGKWAAGGAINVAGSPTTVALIQPAVNGWWGSWTPWWGGWGGASMATNGTAWTGAWWTKWSTRTLEAIKYRRCIEIGPWWWWGGGVWGASQGAWWAWWWALIIEVWGNLTLNNSTTVINMNWVAWDPGSGSWWGWWWGGSVYIMYDGTLTWTCTPTVAWWTWWSTWWWAWWAWLQLIEKNIVFS